MCGFAGIWYFDPNQKVPPDVIGRMTGTLLHRGPDDEGFFIDNNLGLGFRRLSIIDLASGHQPLSISHDSLWITFNGEIYNYRELKEELISKGYKFRTNSDTEVVLVLYEEYGSKCVEYLRGMFAFVIWDRRSKLLFGARDRLGKKPFYYSIDHKKFIWASEIKAIAAHKEFDNSIDSFAMHYYMAYGYMPAGQSIFSSVKKLEPGDSFTISCSNKILNISKYWDFRPKVNDDIREDVWTKLLLEELQNSVRLRMISDVPLGAFLSGGFDSSSVVALMSLFSDMPVKTFSIGFREKPYNELPYAKIISDQYHTDHHEYIVEPESLDLLPKLVRSYDEPFADNSAIPTYILSKFAREHVTVVLSGDGGDEVFAGYRQYRRMNALFKTGISGFKAFRGLSGLINRFIPDYLYQKGYTYYLSKKPWHLGAYYCLWRDYERKHLFSKDFLATLNQIPEPEQYKINLLDGLEGDLLSKLQQLDLKTYLADDILVKVDRVSMINSLEVRTPLLDHKLIELAFQIPSSFKIRRHQQKYIFKKTMEPFLPSVITNRKKQGFSVPLDYWFKDSLREYAHETLMSSHRLKYVLNMKSVEEMLRNHQKGFKDYGNKIWALLFLNEWFNQNT